MQRVGKAVMYKILFSIFIIISFSACSNSKANIQKEENTSTRYYQYVSKDAIFEAAKKVFKYAGRSNFRIDSYRDNLYVSKTKLTHYPLYAVTYEDVWNLTVSEENDTSKAKLEIFRITDFDEENKKYIDKQNHELFWRRVNYLLGYNNTWQSCIFNSDLKDLLCDSVDMHDYIDANKNDIITNRLIVDRKKTKSISEVENDILKDDIVLSIDDSSEDDILAKEDYDNKEKLSTQGSLDESLDKEIEELDRKVNQNVEDTLNKIEQALEKEPVLEKEK